MQYIFIIIIILVLLYLLFKGIIYLLGGIYAFILFTGINIFILLDSIFVNLINTKPLIVWTIVGFIIGISVGIVRVGIKKNIKYIIPIGFIFPFLIVFLFFAKISIFNNFGSLQSKNNTNINSKQITTTGMIISNAGANIRSGPSSSYAITGSLKYKEIIEIISASNNWYKVQYVKEGITNTGFIHNSLIKLNSNNFVQNIPKVENKIIKKISISIKSFPNNSSVYVSNQEEGKTPLTIELESGTNRLMLKYPGYKDFIKNIQINSESKTDFYFTLEPKYDLIGKWTGIFDNDKSMTLLIESFNGSRITGYNIVQWTNETESKVPFSGSFNLDTGNIEIEEIGEGFGIGKFSGTISLDGKILSGEWLRKKNPTQTYNWKVTK